MLSCNELIGFGAGSSPPPAGSIIIDTWATTFTVGVHCPYGVETLTFYARGGGGAGGYIGPNGGSVYSAGGGGGGGLAQGSVSTFDGDSFLINAGGAGNTTVARGGIILISGYGGMAGTSTFPGMGGAGGGGAFDASVLNQVLTVGGRGGDAFAWPGTPLEKYNSGDGGVGGGSAGVCFFNSHNPGNGGSGGTVGRGGNGGGRASGGSGYMGAAGASGTLTPGYPGRAGITMAAYVQNPGALGLVLVQW